MMTKNQGRSSWLPAFSLPPPRQQQQQLQQQDDEIMPNISSMPVRPKSGGGTLPRARSFLDDVGARMLDYSIPLSLSLSLSQRYQPPLVCSSAIRNNNSSSSGALRDRANAFRPVQAPPRNHHHHLVAPRRPLPLLSLPKMKFALVVQYHHSLFAAHHLLVPSCDARRQWWWVSSRRRRTTNWIRYHPPYSHPNPFLLLDPRSSTKPTRP
jgi:hypothetical protein